MSALAARRAPVLPLPVARGLAFFALAAFGALQWMALLEPAEPRRAVYGLGAALLAVGLLLAAARLPGRLRPAAAAAAGAATVALAVLGGGVADELLRPDRWPSLFAGIGRGLEALPGIRVPYRGVDEWVHNVLGAGCTVLTVAAALAAFWPRRGGRLGSVPLALFLLVALYAVPAVALDFGGEFVRGAVLAVLVLVFLRLERLQAPDLRIAAALAGAMAVAALALAPALDSDEPWWDYESWALGAASARSTSFSWDHSYGPLNWPRDGRELLRVRAERAAYWKAANLERFDVASWRREEGDFEEEPPLDPEVVARGSQSIEVTVRNLATEDYVTAGYATDVEAPTVREIARGDGTWVAGRQLRRGDAYTAQVYTPQPGARERRFADDVAGSRGLARNLRLFLPGAGDAIGQTGAPVYQFDFPAYGDLSTEVRVVEPDSSDAAVDFSAPYALENGPYAESWRLAQRLRGQSGSQEEFVENVLEWLARDVYTYTEAPAPEAQNLEGFLFDARAGYCQQFSGAMAMLLRMGGVPARVATGFTSGSRDEGTGEFVVRDLDAHSWVEVWYQGIGWVTFDPTPASAPARAQPAEAGSAAGGGSVALPGGGVPGDIPSDPGRRGLAAGEGGGPGPYVTGGAAALAGLAAAGGLLVFRRRRRTAAAPPAAVALGELERALRRAGRHPGAGVTLSALEDGFARRSPTAAGYVRAVRELRYGARASGPTAAQRRGLRAELARGGGLGARLRAWWALPPGTG